MRKRILIISAFEPSLKSGGESFTLSLLNYLNSENDVDLVFFANNKEVSKTHYPINYSQGIHVSKYRKLFNALSFPVFHPFFTARFSFKYLAIISQLVNRNDYDWIVYNFSQVQIYSLFIKSIPGVLMTHDVIGQKYSREYYSKKIQTPLVHIIEKKIFRNIKNAIFTFSSKDCNYIKTEYNVSSMATSFFIPDEIAQLQNVSGLDRGDYFVLFGHWGRPENIEGLEWLVQNVLPLVQDVPLHIIGSGLPEELIKDFKNVVYHGFVENPYLLISRSLGLLAPVFKGAGVKVKVFESLACGIPVLGTDISFEGIDEALTNYMSVCDSAQDYVVRMTELQKTPSVRSSIISIFNQRYKVPQICRFLSS